MPNALRYRQWKTPKQPGERARLKVVHGPDSGSVFVVTAEKFTIGRGDENDVVLADLRASRRHAEVVRLPTGAWRLRDQGSQNGFVYNGSVTREANLMAGDIVTVGETAFEFVTEESGTKFLQSPARSVPKDYLYGKVGTAVAVAAPRAAVPAAAISQNFLPPAQSSADFNAMAGLAGMNASGGSAGGGAEKRKKILIGAVVVMAAWMFFDDSTPKKTGVKDPKVAKKEKEAAERKAERDLAAYLPPITAGGVISSAETFFKEGFREFREKNYLRARVQFETALQINPSHSMAKSFLRECDRAIANDVQTHLDRGRRDLDAGKLKSARSHFEAVERLLTRDQENASFIEARDQLRTVETRMKMGAPES